MKKFFTSMATLLATGVCVAIATPPGQSIELQKISPIGGGVNFPP